MRIIKGKDESEHAFQCKLIGYLRVNAHREILYFAIPLGGMRHPRVAMKLKAEGVIPGPADLVFLLPEGKAAWLELKTRTGRLSDHQVGFRVRCEQLGHSWGLARSLEEAIPILKSWNVIR